jgi:hypothetical protein
MRTHAKREAATTFRTGGAVTGRPKLRYYDGTEEKKGQNNSEGRASFWEGRFIVLTGPF